MIPVRCTFAENDMEITGYIVAIFIGISLGLIGSGGSVLTVPVLVYLFGIEPVMATAYSLFIVGATSLAGVLPKFRQGLVDIRTAIVFGAPSIAAVFVTRKFLVPLIPPEIAHIGSFAITRNILMMVLFAILMIIASVSMIREAKHKQDVIRPRQFNYGLILLEGLIVGALTGLVGAGGGFLIIPALVLLSGLPMKQAVGTSLLIIAAKSLIGFTGDVFNYEMNWGFLLVITALATGGIFIGNMLSHKIPAGSLKKAFGWFVLLMGLFIIIRELFM